MTRPTREPSWSDAGPFKFLDYFTEEDEEGFAGRDRDVRAALAGVLKASTFVLYGGSGTGKTSLLFAGLFPELRRHGFRPIYVRTLNDPLADLRRAVVGKLADEPQSPDAELEDLVAALTCEKQAVLVFDQFEEFFIRFRTQPEKREPFIAALGRIAADPQLAVKLLFSLRQEYLGELDDLRAHLPQLLDNEYRLKPLTAFGARQAIASQLRRANVPFERRFLTRVVDLLERDNFDPTILQIVCSEVFRQAMKAMSAGRDKLRLTAEDVDAVGDVRLLFRRYLDEMAASLPAERQLMVRSVLNALILGKRTRRAATLATLHQESTRDTENAVREVLVALTLFRLVRKDDQGEEIWYELTHERLGSVVREWLELDELFRQFRTARNLIANMVREDWRRDPEMLLTDHRIDKVVQPVADHLRLDSTELEFLLRSAVFRQNREATIYWAGRYGAERSRQVVLAMLADGKTVIHAAARMARNLDDPDAELALECARLAARKESDEIAAEAYFSVLRLARGEHRQLMREALAEHRPREKPPGRLRRLLRFVRFQRLVNRTRRHAARQAMGELYRQPKARILDGLLAGLGWCFLVGLAIFGLLFAWPAGMPELVSVENLGYGTLFFVLVAVALAAHLPGAVARSLGHVRPSWPRIVVGWWASFGKLMGFLFVAGVAVYLVVAGDFQFMLLRLIAAVALFLLLLFPAALLVKLGGHALRPEDPERKIWGWSLVASCGLPILLPGVAVVGPAYLWAILAGAAELPLFGDAPEMMQWAIRLAVAAALALSFQCFIFHLLLARSGLPSGSEPVTAGRRRRARIIAVAATALNLLGWLFALGPDTVPLPLLAERQDLASNASVEYRGNLGPGYPDVDYLRLHSEEPVLLKIGGSVGTKTKDQELELKLEELDLGTALARDHVLALPGRSEPYLGAVGPSKTLSTMRLPWELSFRVVGTLDPEEIRLSQHWSYWMVNLKAEQTPSAEIWIGELNRAVPSERSAAYDVEVVVFRNQPTSSRSPFAGTIEIQRQRRLTGIWTAVRNQEAQNCDFVNQPILTYPPGTGRSSRGTWKIPVRRWPARILLSLPQPSAAARQFGPKNRIRRWVDRIWLSLPQPSAATRQFGPENSIPLAVGARLVPRK